MNPTLDQIKKLLALANCPSATAGEIQAAMGRVAHLAEKNNISDVEIEKASRANGSEGVRISVNHEDMVDEIAFVAATMGRWDKWLGIAVQESTDAQCYIGWDRATAKTAIRFYGLPQDVAVAKELFLFARSALSRSARQWKRDQMAQMTASETRTFKDGFCSGLIKAAKERTVDAQEKTEVEVSGTTALVLITDIKKAKKDALRIRSRRLGLTTGRACGGRTFGGSAARGAGESAGRATNLSRNGISGQYSS